MKNTTVLYAFTRPNLASIKAFADFVHGQLPDHVDIKIGMTSDQEIHGVEGIDVFPDRTSVAEMLNQLAARAEGTTLLINDGVVLPNLAADVWEGVQDLALGTTLTIDGRRPISLPNALDTEIENIAWNEVEFNRSVHEESPLTFAVSRRDFLHIRGFDERPTFDTCRTMDLLARLRRSGNVQRPISDLATFSLDVHNSFPGLTDEKIPLMVSTRENHKTHVQSDLSIYRNLDNWSVPREGRQILVTVSIATRDRSEYLADSINSVLAQTFEDFELIVVDDGSEDDTESVVRSFTDDRVVYMRQEPTGISAARNLAADHSVGHFTAVHDDDDIMLPWRLATSLRTITASEHASYGSWVNFDDETAEMVLHITKMDFGRDLVAYSGQTPGHATWLLPTAYICAIRYDESLTSSVDHNLAVRAALSGLRWRHSEKVLFLRRIHPSQVSQTDSRRQRAAAVLTRYANGFSADFSSHKLMVERGKVLTFPAPADKSKLFETFGAYLPDHLVEREVLIQGLVGKKVLALDLHDRFQFIAAETDLKTSRSTLELGGANSIRWEDMVSLRRLGIVGSRFMARKREGIGHTLTKIATLPSTVDMIVQDRQARELRSVVSKHPAGAVLRLSGEHISTSDIESPGLISAKEFSINYGDFDRRHFFLFGFTSLELATSFETKVSRIDESRLILVPSNRDFLDIADNYLRKM